MSYRRSATAVGKRLRPWYILIVANNGIPQLKHHELKKQFQFLSMAAQKRRKGKHVKRFDCPCLLACSLVLLALVDHANRFGHPAGRKKRHQRLHRRFSRDVYRLCYVGWVVVLLVVSACFVKSATRASRPGNAGHATRRGRAEGSGGANPAVHERETVWSKGAQPALIYMADWGGGGVISN